MRRFNKLLAGAALAIGLTAAAGAQAGVVFSHPGPTGAVNTGGSAFAVFSSVGGAGHISFTVNGYNSLDGVNFWEDDFTFSLNGTPIISGSWDLGGGGGNVTFFAPTGSNITPSSFGVFAGGQVLIDAPLTLAAGLNNINFRYDSLPAPGHAGFQGFPDEAWGLSDITVTERGGVPEPAAWALMLMGFGGLGAMIRRRRATPVTA